MEYEPYLLEAMERTAEAVEKTLAGFLPEVEGVENRLLDAMRYSMFAGGKRLRPFLAVASADLFDVAKSRSLRVAAAIECVHCYSLIHDDLPAMDDDDLRRGKPTLHLQFDEATAILAGDGLLTLAFEILADADTHSDPRVRCELVGRLAGASGIHGMVGGQMIDLDAEEKELDIGEVTRLQQLKTGALIAVSAEAGAILGRANQHQRNLLANYARDLGLAFQIADDLLDHESDPETLGKATQKDAARGKATFVSLLGADRARQQAQALADQAIGHLKEFEDRAALLNALARFVVERKN